MKSAIKIISGFVAIVVFTAMLAYSFSGLKVEKVKDFGVKERGLTFASLCWKESEKATGYNIYQKNLQFYYLVLVYKIKHDYALI